MLRRCKNILLLHTTLDPLCLGAYVSALKHLLAPDLVLDDEEEKGLIYRTLNFNGSNESWWNMRISN